MECTCIIVWLWYFNSNEDSMHLRVFVPCEQFCCAWTVFAMYNQSYRLVRCVGTYSDIFLTYESYFPLLLFSLLLIHLSFFLFWWVTSIMFIIFKRLTFIYLTTITKQVIQLIIIMLVCIDVYVQLSDHMTISHVDVYRTQVAAVRGERVNTIQPDSQYIGSGNHLFSNS